MNRDLERVLQARFPRFFQDLYGDPRETCMAYGCDFEDGWYPIVERLCEELEPLAPLEFKFTQVKEKLGAMRIYASGGNEETKRLIQQASEESLKVCEQCGATKGVDTRGTGRWGWIRTLCQSCRGL
jgi:hypothetical protein